MAKYEDLATYIITNIGGKDNIDNVTHCMTRLRFKLKDESQVKADKLKKRKEVVTVQSAGGKYQVVIGTYVNEVYEEVLKQLDGKSEEISEKAEGSLINRFTNLLTQIMLPALGALGASCLIKALLNIMVAMSLINKLDGAYILLNGMGSAALYFFPIILGYTSAKTFKMNPFSGMLLGAILVYPTLAAEINTGEALFTLFEGSGFAMPVYKTFFGIPIFYPPNGYSSTVIPIIFSTFCASKIEHLFAPRIPQAMKNTLLNFLTVGLGAILTFLIVGPITLILTNAISVILDFLFSKSTLLAGTVISLIYMPLVVLGLHWPLISIAIINYATIGCDIIMATLFPAPFACMGICLAVYLRSQSKELKSICTSSFISSVFCIIEPAFYGVMIPVKKRFWFGMLGSLAGGLIICLTNSVKYTVGSGVLGYLTFINPNNGSVQGVIIALLATLTAMIISFILTWVSYKPGEDNYSDENEDVNSNKISKNETIYSPMKGMLNELNKMKDPAFSNGSLGKGICIVPSEGRVVAPCDGVIASLFPTGHALCIKSEKGSEVLIHIGANTSELKKGTFTKHVLQGATVKKGELLITFNLENLKKEGYSLDTAVIVTNSEEYLDIVPLLKPEVNYIDPLMISVISESACTAEQLVLGD